MSQNHRLASESFPSAPAALGPATLLEAWERSCSGGLASRVTALLGLVYPQATPDGLLSLSLGERNRALLSLHAALLGPKIDCVVPCGSCRELNELSLRVSDLMLPAGVTPPEGFLVEHGEWAVRFRLPNTADLIAALAVPTLNAMRRMVVERCALSSTPSGTVSSGTVSVHQDALFADGAAVALPDEVIEAVSLSLAKFDPAAELIFHLNCAGCRQRFTTLLDPTYLVWEELRATSQRLLGEVDALARVYHWSERDILAMSPLRRSAYLGMVNA